MSWLHEVSVLGFFAATLFLKVSPAFAEMGGDGRVDKTDSCYFVMIDRFFNGDPSNDDQGSVSLTPAILEPTMAATGKG